MAGSDALEVARPLPRSHCGVELALLDAREVEIVLDHVVAERVAQKRRALGGADRLAQGARHLRQTNGCIEVPDEHRRWRELALAAVEAPRGHSPGSGIRVSVGA